MSGGSCPRSPATADTLGWLIEDPRLVNELVETLARNTHSAEHRKRGREVAKTVIPYLHGCQCVALCADRFDIVPWDFNLDGPGEEILLVAAVRVFLQDSDDPDLPRIVRREAGRVVKDFERLNGTRRTHDRKQIEHDLWEDYLVDPPDYLKVSARVDAERVWTMFIGALKGKLGHLLEDRSRRAPGEPSARTLRYRKQKGIQLEDLPASGETTRSKLAKALEISPTELKRLEDTGLLNPRKLKTAVVYGPAEILEACRLLRARGRIRDEEE